MNNKNLMWAAVAVLALIVVGVWMYSSSSTNQPGTVLDTVNPAGTQEEGAVTPDNGNPTVDTDTGSGAPGAAAPSVKSFTVSGSNFAFAPSTMTVNKGDTVRITFKNANGFHDLVIDEFDARTKQMGAGQEETIEFVADKTGSFEYHCSVGNHRAQGMRGTLTVQ